MFNYCIFEVYHKDGAIFETIGANFKARGIKHSHSMLETYIGEYQRKNHPLELTVNYQVYFRSTNPAFAPDQLKVYRGKVSGCVSRKIAPLNTLKTMT